MEKKIYKCGEGDVLGHTQNEYDNIGLSSCGKYVAHWIENPCDDNKSIINHRVSDKPHECWCRTGVCPCGSFVSHRIDEPCTAKVIHR